MKRLFLLVLLTGLNALPLTAKPLVVSVQYPQAFFAQTLGAEAFEVVNLTPPGIESHEYQPGLRSLAKASRAQLLIYNSPRLEPWAAKLGEEVVKQGGAVWVLETDFGTPPGSDAQSASSGGQGFGYDPHLWLNPLLAAKLAERLAQELIKLQPQEKEGIEQRLAGLKQKLLLLDQAFEAGLLSCKHKELLVAHDAYGYLAKRYGLSTYALHDLNAESRPGLGQMAAAVKLIRSKGLKVVYFEELVDPRLSLTLAQETGARALPLYPLDNLGQEQLDQGLGYFELMGENLKNLQLGLGCKTNR
ncbi:MAG: hypothetical protein A2600_13700 [Candidatus Lambdaproteobacteria bacterium RIFOXYD1_FULL_56_27]|uniref:High-affinity zinc uptake system protein ZnuA n=1 Tax=Candidatus Lambdaproteobacteria bacterium RIFOXYD2_FULL_56_26 TaxID=1817773 RepID=A0A1F6GRW6_9PROT|nr:MAG: hypothetical protein A2426_11085 [Candidatus Lambdaproteobacteria bacterium RIFOXYC1_FULL_56_13]OGH00883.1 MAG: hypothetical protein A2557_01990 [Candidatus Lambdaproteobacteria bacterium RIFOXYD2_FULL_56_26]OGH08129.1 MAG: hypothetical protein A2600_13700 [Candidatus Lambdaproteobacteria bacterium RIFOXYD1_FULL_56_27]